MAERATHAAPRARRIAGGLLALALGGSSALASSAAAQSFTFAPAVTRACTPQHTPTRVVATDVNGDGQLDLLIPGRDQDGLVNWVTLDASGVPGVMQTLACTGQTDAAAIADFNGDGRSDIGFAVRSSRGRVALYLRGEGGLPLDPVEFGLERVPTSIVTGDWNGDRNTDIASLQSGNSALLVLHGTGGGGFTLAQRLRIEPWSGGTVNPQELLAGDVNGDGRADLVASMVGSRRIDIFLARADGTFAPPVAWEAIPVPGQSAPGVTTIAVGDVDGDGDLDVVATLISTQAIQPVMVFLNDGQGGFAQRVRFDGPESGLGWGTALADLDGDGDLDLVTGTALPGGLYVWENTTTSGGVVHFEAPQQIGSGTFVRDICVAHLDSDCDLDIAYAEIGNHTVRVYRQLRECGAGSAALHAGAPRAQALKARDAEWEAATAQGRALTARVTSATELAQLLATWGPPPGEAAPLSFLLMGDEYPSCGPAGPGGRCDEPHMTPGCFTTPCCEKVCSFDPGCCAVAWDLNCVEIADQECSGLVCPQYGACTEPHLDPGCEDTACCQRITRLDGTCQGALWDHICVEKALLLCGVPPCTITVPPEAVPEDEPCYKHLNDGPSSADGGVLWPACGEIHEGACTTGSPRDTDWYRIPGSGPRRVRFTVTAEFPCEVHLVAGTFSGPLRAEASVYGGFCAPVILDACIPDDEPRYAVVTLGMTPDAIRRGQPCMDQDPENPWPPEYQPTPGFDGVRYLAQIQCSACGNPADLNHDGVVNGADLGMLLAAWGLTGNRPEDLNGDGSVSGADLGILLSLWGPVLD